MTREKNSLWKRSKNEKLGLLRRRASWMGVAHLQWPGGSSTAMFGRSQCAHDGSKLEDASWDWLPKS